jgi:hypothetical protein
MVGESKILTVSYGTFSCTLEGFDDSFSTMKAIAEYFKGLAAEDRFFGAEPPAPDAETLMRIAEREVKSRVEAQIGDGGITLRRSEDPSARPQDTDSTVEESAETAPQPVVEQAAETIVATSPAPTARPAASPFTSTEVGDSDSVAAKLSRIRAVVSRAPNAAASHDTEDENSNGLMDPIESAFKDISQEASAPAPEAPQIAPEEIAPTDFDTAEEEAAEEAQQDAYEQATDEAATEAPIVEEAEAVVAQTPDDISAEVAQTQDDEIQHDDAEDDDGVLAGVGAFMAHSDNTAPQADEEYYSNEQGDTPIEATDISSILGAVSNEANTSADAPVENIEDTAETDTVDFSAITDSLSQDDVEIDAAEAEEAISAEIEETASEEASFQEPADEISQDDIADLSRIDGTDIAATEIPEEVKPEEVVAEAEAEIEADEGERVAKPSVTSVAARARARVIRVKRADLADAIEGDSGAELVETGDADQHVENTTYDVTELQETPSEAATVETESDAALSDEDEADLMAQLAAAVGDEAAEINEAGEAQIGTAGDEIDENDDALDRAIGAAIGDVHAPLPEVTPHQTLAKEADDEKMNRLMEESESQFAETEGSRRRSAIAHLKAAVAATVADRKILGGTAPKDDDVTTDYRKDLAEVVRPSRAKRLLGKKDTRPAPLMLVSEQRIDSHDGPAVQPRRVGKSALGLRDVNEGLATGSDLDEKSAKHLAESKSFAEFAERVGATDLPDLLEAAAAYTAFVEGLEHFTRPQVMRRVLRFSEDQGVTREEGLRSFGLLLRQGKIEKVKRGQFRVSESTRFRPDARIAGE